MLNALVYLTLLLFAVPLAFVGYVETRRGDTSAGLYLGAGALALIVVAMVIGMPASDAIAR